MKSSRARTRKEVMVLAASLRPRLVIPPVAGSGNSSNNNNISTSAPTDIKTLYCKTPTFSGACKLTIPSYSEGIVPCYLIKLYILESCGTDQSSLCSSVSKSKGKLCTMEVGLLYVNRPRNQGTWMAEKSISQWKKKMKDTQNMRKKDLFFKAY